MVGRPEDAIERFCQVAQTASVPAPPEAPPRQTNRPDEAISKFCNMAQSTVAPPPLKKQPMAPDAAVEMFCNMAKNTAAPPVAAKREPLGPDAALNMFINQVGGSAQAGGYAAALQPSPVPVPGGTGQDDSRKQFAISSSTSTETATTAEGASVALEPSVTRTEFPEVMFPMELQATSFRPGDFTFDAPTEENGGCWAWTIPADKLGFAAHRALSPHLERLPSPALSGEVSEKHHLTLSNDDIRALGVNKDSRFFAFSYPVKLDADVPFMVDDNADVAFVRYGGFLYFDSDMALKDVRAVTPGTGAGMALRYGAAQRWLPAWTAAMRPAAWRRVTIPALQEVGVRHFTWIRPGESHGGSPPCRHGAFAYIFHEPRETDCLQSDFDVYFDIQPGTA